jgi:hypothetical protein
MDTLAASAPMEMPIVGGITDTENWVMARRVSETVRHACGILPVPDTGPTGLKLTHTSTEPAVRAWTAAYGAGVKGPSGTARLATAPCLDACNNLVMTAITDF